MHHHDLPEDAPDRQSMLDDWRGVGDLIAVATDRIAAPVEGMHKAIVGRWMRLGGSTVEPARRLVDGLTGAIYQTVRIGGVAVGSAISVGAELASNRVTLRPVWGTPGGRSVQAIVNGLWGDAFDGADSPFGIQLGFRTVDGDQVAIDPTALSEDFPSATSRLAVMIHGFGETEGCWLSDDDSDLSSALERDGFTVLLLRYNSGCSIADNGSDLASLLESVSTSWPVAVEEIDLIGHSMGGLVARSAIAAARSAQFGWVETTRHLVAIGAPHLGSPIEKGVQLVSSGLGLFAESRPLQSFLDQRSVGIKDLRHGIGDDEDDLDGIDQHFVAGTITARSNHPIGSLFGDLVVRVGSATGEGRRRHVQSSDVLIVGGQHHAGLLRDGEVRSQIRGWLASRE